MHGRDKREEAGAKDFIFGIGFSLFELRKHIAFNPPNGRKECYVREATDEKTHIRGQTEMLDHGRMRVRPLTPRACWTFDSAREELTASLGWRAVGSSSVHDQSSRAHAILKLEIINSKLMEVRRALVKQESQLVPVGKRTTDVVVE
ncbi:hypothetical protein GGR51DRAFT_526431 [Nemania sp. FL0031]|nr:hypothetical protein GGR51DRAFT_526431 [Nemania sp. FL0031]